MLVADTPPKRAPWRPTLFEDGALTRRFWLRLTPQQWEDLQAVADELNVDRTYVIREALDEFVADYRERRVFDRRRSSMPTTEERRNGNDRRNGSRDPQ